MKVDNDEINQAIVEALNKKAFFMHIGGFATCACAPGITLTNLTQYNTALVKTWAPELHKYHAKYMNDLRNAHPELKFPFAASIFPTTTYNLGPTVSHQHLDFGTGGAQSPRSGILTLRREDI